MTLKKASMVIEGATHWRCSSCKEWLSADRFYSDKRTPNGLKAQCKACHTATSIRTRDAENHRAKRRESARRAYAKNPEKLRAAWRNRPQRTGPKPVARQMVYLALRIGALVRPEVCECCGERKKLTAHHEDYQKPLDVQWLCHLCHAEKHRKT